MDYAELHCLSNFSFLRGASHPEELVARAAELGYTALAITDECSVAGAVRAHLAARELPLGFQLRSASGRGPGGGRAVSGPVARQRGSSAVSPGGQAQGGAAASGRPPAWAAGPDLPPRLHTLPL